MTRQRKNDWLKVLLPLTSGVVALVLSLLLFDNCPIGIVICLIVLFVSLICSLCFFVSKSREEQRRKDYTYATIHELKTPLASLQLLAEMLSDETLSLDTENKKRLLSEVKSQIERLKGLVQNVLSNAKADNGSVAIRLQTFGLNDLLFELANSFSDKIKQADGSLSVETNETDIALTTDKDLFSNIIINLVENAIKYSDKQTLIRLVVKPFEEGCMVIVQDKGVGISSKDTKHIFKKYYRADGSSKTQSKTSFGLGLYYVARTAKALKIKIKVESTPGEGSSFILFLPEKMITNTRQEKQS